MGRPLNKRYFGQPTADGDEIKVQFHNGTGSVNGWIVKQKGSKRFLCTDGSNEKLCTLVDKASASVAAGEMTISARLDDDSIVQITKIAGRKITADTGTIYPWSFVQSTVDGVAEVEEAGAPTIAATDITAITLTGTDPVAIESTTHGLTTGDTVLIAGVVGTTELNDNRYVVTVVDADNITLDSTDSSNFTAYTSDGTVQKVTSDDFEGDTV